MPDVERMSKIYIKMRDAKSTLTREYEAKAKELDEQMSMLAAAMLHHCDANSQKSFSTEFATVSVVERTRYWPSDWEKFSAWAVENNVPEVFEKRLSQRVIAQMLEEDPEIVIPTLNADRVRTVQVRKK